jgi:hypothetical protein
MIDPNSNTPCDSHRKLNNTRYLLFYLFLLEESLNELIFTVKLLL